MVVREGQDPTLTTSSHLHHPSPPYTHTHKVLPSYIFQPQ